MASQYPGPVQVGSYFVRQYYQVLQQHPDLVHQFYSDASTMIRVDGDASESASTMLKIHSLATSLPFTAIEVKTINSLESWNGGILVMVSGSVQTKDLDARRKFVQTFFLAPQEKGYFVLNDMFQFVDDQISHQPPDPVSLENKFDAQFNVPTHVREQPAPDYILEEQAREIVCSVHIQDDSVDRYSNPEEQEQEDSEEVESVEEAPVEDTPALHQPVVNTVQEPLVAAVEEPVGEPQKKTYASILLVSKEQHASLVSAPPSSTKYSQTTSDWEYIPEPVPQQSTYASSYVPESDVSSYAPETVAEASERSFSPEGETRSVYVRNLPSTVNAAEIELEFQNFGIIKPDGVFIRNRKDVPGVCYAFVEFEDVSGAQNAIQASPIHLAGRQVYIEERRPNLISGYASRGGGRRGRGRGSGSYQTEGGRGRFGGSGLSRGSTQDSNRLGGNGVYQQYH